MRRPLRPERVLKELLPVTLGVLAGGGAAALRSLRLRMAALPVGAVVGGATASAINGELADERWALFLTFDALLVWLCAFVTCGLVRSLRLVSAERPERVPREGAAPR